MKDIFEMMISLLGQGESFVLATLFSSSGSAPRTAGAYMIMRADGTTHGTIGGGLLEAKVQQAAPELFKKKNSAIMQFKLTGKDASVMEMICGGEVEVLVEYIDSGDETYLNLFKEFLAAMKSHRKAWQILSLPETGGEFSGAGRCLVTAKDPTVHGWAVTAATGKPNEEIPGELVNEVMERPEISQTQYPVVMPFPGRRILVEPATHFGTVYLMGGGHISQKLAPLTHMIGFETVVVDDRPEYVSEERFPTADRRVLVDSFSLALNQFSLDSGSYIIIVTRGHLHDRAVLAQALQSQAGYIGMIGSLRKRNLIYDQLEENGFSREDFQRIHAPIGLPIGAESPEEIAVSIAGELIKVRSGKK
jgi:xanthine dehydrogenase accessory factor